METMRRLLALLVTIPEAIPLLLQALTEVEEAVVTRCAARTMDLLEVTCKDAYQAGIEGGRQAGIAEQARREQELLEQFPDWRWMVGWDACESWFLEHLTPAQLASMLPAPTPELLELARAGKKHKLSAVLVREVQPDQARRAASRRC